MDLLKKPLPGTLRGSLSPKPASKFDDARLIKAAFDLFV